MNSFILSPPERSPAPSDLGPQLSALDSRLTAELNHAARALCEPDCSFYSFGNLDLNQLQVADGPDFAQHYVLSVFSGPTLGLSSDRLPTQFHNQVHQWSWYFQALSRAFCEAFRVTQVTLKVSQFSNDHCSLFHVDFVRVRLIQTLLGPGTEYLLEEQVDRDGLGKGCNSLVLKGSAPIQRAGCREILIMRGNQWVKGRGLVHRSPSIESSGQKRVLITVEPVSGDT